jgi:hypothetical protein
MDDIEYDMFDILSNKLSQQFEDFFLEDSYRDNLRFFVEKNDSNCWYNINEIFPVPILEKVNAIHKSIYESHLINSQTLYSENIYVIWMDNPIDSNFLIFYIVPEHGKPFHCSTNIEL